MHQIRFRLGSVPDTARELTALPQTYLDFRGLLLREGKERRGQERRGRRKEGGRGLSGDVAEEAFCLNPPLDYVCILYTICIIISGRRHKI